ncbi:MAG TPA: DoxX family protein [Terriglobales bacterium]|nr:DoxX family protein [Terriglobales bacterium]
MRIIQRLYTYFVQLMNLLQSPLLLAVRLYWGWQFFQAGWGKIHDISKPIQFFASIGIPFPTANAYFVSYLECVGGILLAIGLGGRLISIPLLIDMIVAYLKADNEAWHSFLSDPGKFYAADPYTFLFAALLILIFGPGAISIDYLIRRRLDRDEPAGHVSRMAMRR